MRYNELTSPYIEPFLNRKEKNNQELLEAIDSHENHQVPLPPDKAFLEGKVTPYSLKDKKFYGRR